MTDKNGIELKTGMIVRVTGGYFKADNGLFFIEHSPGDPGWCGRDYSLHKINASGKISTAKYNIAFWPLSVTVSGWAKKMEARRWNAEHAEIEVCTVKDYTELRQHFLEEADGLQPRIDWEARNWGETAAVKEMTARQRQYRAIAESL